MLRMRLYRDWLQESIFHDAFQPDASQAKLNCRLCCTQHILLQVTNFKDDEVVLVCSKDHALHDCRHVTKTQLRQLKYVSLFQSSTVKAIRKTLEANHIQWQSLQVVLVNLAQICSFPTKLDSCLNNGSLLIASKFSHTWFRFAVS